MHPPSFPSHFWMLNLLWVQVREVTPLVGAQLVELLARTHGAKLGGVYPNMNPGQPSPNQQKPPPAGRCPQHRSLHVAPAAERICRVPDRCVLTEAKPIAAEPNP